MKTGVVFETLWAQRWRVGPVKPDVNFGDERSSLGVLNKPF